jgi:Tfp pilus assembly protein PilV
LPRPIGGFLLIEVLVALVITAVATAALVNFQLELYRAGALAAQRTDALSVAAVRLEALQGGIRAGSEQPESGTESVDAMADGEPFASGTVYLTEWTLTAAVGVVMVDVTARWEDRDGRAYVIALSSAAVPLAALGSGMLAVKPEYIGLP